MKKNNEVKKEFVTIKLDEYKNLLESDRVLRELAQYRFAISPKGLLPGEFFRYRIYRDEKLKLKDGWQDQTLLRMEIIFKSAQNFADSKNTALKARNDRERALLQNQIERATIYNAAKSIFEFLERSEKLPIKRSEIVNVMKPVWEKRFKRKKMPKDKTLFDYQTKYIREKSKVADFSHK